MNYQNNATINDVLAYLADMKTNLDEQVLDLKSEFQSLKRGQQKLENQSCGKQSQVFGNLHLSNTAENSVFKEIEDSLRDMQNVSEIRHKEMLSEFRRYTEVIEGEASVDDYTSCISKFTVSHICNTWSGSTGNFLRHFQT